MPAPESDDENDTEPSPAPTEAEDEGEGDTEPSPAPTEAEDEGEGDTEPSPAPTEMDGSSEDDDIGPSPAPIEMDEGTSEDDYTTTTGEYDETTPSPVALPPPVTPFDEPSPVTPPTAECEDPVEAHEQCGGTGYEGSTCCVSGYECREMADCYSEVRALGWELVWSHVVYVLPAVLCIQGSSGVSHLLGVRLSAARYCRPEHHPCTHAFNSLLDP